MRRSGLSHISLVGSFLRLVRRMRPPFVPPRSPDTSKQTTAKNNKLTRLKWFLFLLFFDFNCLLLLASPFPKPHRKLDPFRPRGHKGMRCEKFVRHYSTNVTRIAPATISNNGQNYLTKSNNHAVKWFFPILLLSHPDRATPHCSLSQFKHFRHKVRTQSELNLYHQTSWFRDEWNGQAWEHKWVKVFKALLYFFVQKEQLLGDASLICGIGVVASYKLLHLKHRFVL